MGDRVLLVGRLLLLVDRVRLGREARHDKIEHLAECMVREERGVLEEELERVQMRRPGNGFGVGGYRIDNFIQHRVDETVCERFGVIFAVEKAIVYFGRRYAEGIAHVMLERIVDIKVDAVHVAW